MRFTAKLFQAAKPSDTMKSRTYWHGTTMAAAEEIRKHGIRPQDVRHEGGEMAPIEGRSYFARSLKQAVDYASSRRVLGEQGTSLYIFEIPGDRLHDVIIDEDLIFLMLDGMTWDSGEMELDPIFDKGNPSEMAALKRLHAYVSKFEQPYPYSVSSESRELAKRIVKGMPDDMVLDLLENAPAGLSDEGVIWPTKLWILPEQPYNKANDGVDYSFDARMREWFDKDLVQVINL